MLRTIRLTEACQRMASWAFRFADTFSNALTALSGMMYMEHLQDNLHAFLVSYDRSMARLRQASHCTGCRK